jgi:hypothetical protein
MALKIIAECSLRRTWVSAARIIVTARPVAASGVRTGAIPVAAGRIRPSAPASSTAPIRRTVAAEKSATHGSLSASLSLGWVTFRPEDRGPAPDGPPSDRRAGDPASRAGQQAEAAATSHRLVCRHGERRTG